MYIEENKIRNIQRFELDTAAIGNTSTSKTEVKLPYSSKLPEPYDSATVFFRVSPERVNVVLECRRGSDKPVKYPLTVSREEVKAVLWPFFWTEADGKTCDILRTDNGLSEFWNGSYQSEFMRWYYYGTQPNRIADIILQLPPEKRASLYRTIDLMKSEETTAG